MKKMSLFILISYSFFASGQTEADIRKHYTDINNQITESLKHGYEGSLYNNEWITNKNGRSWPAVGYYSETTDFWYDDPPDHVSAEERNPKTVLLKVTVTRKAAGYSASEEYLYKDGKFLFFFSNEGEEGKQWETRAYFNSKGIMFKSSVKADGRELTPKDLATEEHKDSKPNPVMIMANGKKYQELFVKSM
jgi:hypothetical protein